MDHWLTLLTQFHHVSCTNFIQHNNLKYVLKPTYSAKSAKSYCKFFKVYFCAFKIWRLNTKKTRIERMGEVDVNSDLSLKTGGTETNEFEPPSKIAKNEWKVWFFCCPILLLYFHFRFSDNKPFWLIAVRNMCILLHWDILIIILVFIINYTCYRHNPASK